MRPAATFSSYSVPDIGTAKKFYEETLGLNVGERMGGLELHLEGSAPIFIYPSEKNKPAGYTVLNFIVEDIDAAIEELTKKGVRMESYDLPQMKTDAKGVMRNNGSHPGPKAIAWLKDPAGNILAVIQEQ